MKFDHLRKSDYQLFCLIQKEIKRQKETIDLIASENFAPMEILEVMGSPLTNKYSEGYPGKRYYPGNIYYDEIERLAQERALKAFGLKEKEWAVNVQPYSGSPANFAVYNALLKPNDVLMGMNLTGGGHLTHGHKASITGKIYQSIQYSLDPKTERIDFKKVEKLAKKHKPKIIVSGLTSYSRTIDFKKFSIIAKKVGAFHMADIAHFAGLVASNLHPSPFPYADIVTSTVHKTLRGPRAGIIFVKRNSAAAKKQKIDLAEAIDRSVFPQLQGGPHNNIIAAIALTFKLAKGKDFKNYQRQIIKNSQALAKELKNRGFRLVAGGTDNHLMVIDLRKTGISGMEAEKILEKAGIVANRNVVCGDISPFKPSGLRLGTPAVTTRGMKEVQMKQIADFIFRLLFKKEKPNIIKREAAALCRKFPIYQNI